MSDNDKIKNLENRSWEAMRVLLDQEMPQKKKRKAAFWLWWSTGLSGVAAMLFLWSYVGGLTPTDKQSVYFSDGSDHTNISSDKERAKVENAAPEITHQPEPQSSTTIAATAPFDQGNDYVLAEKVPVARNRSKITNRSTSPLHGFSHMPTKNKEDEHVLVPAAKGEKDIAFASYDQTTTHATDHQETAKGEHSSENRVDVSLPSLPIKPSYIIHSFKPAFDPISPASSYTLSENVQTEGGFYLSNTTFGSLNTPGLFESGLQMTYKLPLSAELALSFGGNLSYSNLSVNYFDPQVYPQAVANQTEKLYQNVSYTDFSLSSSVNEAKKTSKFNWRASVGLTWQMRSNWSLSTEVGLRQYSQVVKNGLLTEKNDVAVPGFSPNDPKEFNFKPHYFQTLGLTYHIQKRWSVSAIYLITGQPFTTGFYISKPIGSVNHFAGLGLTYKL